LARVWRGDGIRFCSGRPDLIGTWSRVFRLALAFGWLIVRMAYRSDGLSFVAIYPSSSVSSAFGPKEGGQKVDAVHGFQSELVCYFLIVADCHPFDFAQGRLAQGISSQ
jgi:hypothetical protein